MEPVMYLVLFFVIALIFGLFNRGNTHKAHKSHGKAYNAGFDSGFQTGLTQGAAHARVSAFRDGKEKGYEIGFKAGYAEAFFIDEDEPTTAIVSNGDLAENPVTVTATRTDQPGDSTIATLEPVPFTSRSLDQLCTWQASQMLQAAIAGSLLMKKAGGDYPTINLTGIERQAKRIMLRYINDEAVNKIGFDYHIAAALVISDTLAWGSDTLDLAKAA